VGTRWLSKRALGLHLAALLVAPGCLLAFGWQLHRALQGNSLSWAYCFEWPIFAVLAVIAWWQLVHDSDVEREARRQPREMPDPVSPMTPTWREQDESEELAAYNRWLKDLSGAGQARGRRR
jgi:hypothetical protein